MSETGSQPAVGEQRLSRSCFKSAKKTNIVSFLRRRRRRRRRGLRRLSLEEVLI